MSKERKLTDTEDFVQGPVGDVKDNNLDPEWVATLVPGATGQGGTDDEANAHQAEGPSGRPGSYGRYED